MKKIISILILILFIGACSSYQPVVQYDKVLAITAAGDTVAVDIDKLRPRYRTEVIYRTQPYYNWNSYMYWNPRPVVRPTVVLPNRPANSPRPNNNSNTNSNGGNSGTKPSININKN